MASAAKNVVESASAEVESSSSSSGDGYYRAARGEVVDVKSDQTIQGFDAERMRARTALTAEEERKLIRRVDWHLMPLCSLMFLFKNLDSDNVSVSLHHRRRILAHTDWKVSNARIMNRGTPQNIMTQLGLTSDEFALVTVLYYVSFILRRPMTFCYADPEIPRFRTLLVKPRRTCF